MFWREIRRRAGSFWERPLARYITGSVWTTRIKVTKGVISLRLVTVVLQASDRQARMQPQRASAKRPAVVKPPTRGVEEARRALEGEIETATAHWKNEAVAVVVHFGRCIPYLRYRQAPCTPGPEFSTNDVASTVRPADRISTPSPVRRRTEREQIEEMGWSLINSRWNSMRGLHQEVVQWRHWQHHVEKMWGNSLMSEHSGVEARSFFDWSMGRRSEHIVRRPVNGLRRWSIRRWKVWHCFQVGQVTD